MYLRRISRKNKNGTETAYLQLAQNEWDPKRGYAKANVIYSFGREDEIDIVALKRLVESISRYLPAQDAIETQGKLSNHGIEFLRSRSYGGVWLMNELWKWLGMPETLKALFKERAHQIDLERLLFAMVANRAFAPMSKLSMEDWVAEDVYIEGLAEVQSHQLYRAMDELLSVRAELEQRVYFSVADLLNLEVDLLYFDTTSSYFEVDAQEAPENETFRKQGYSKDHRPDLLQVVIGLAVTKEGIPIRCWAWPGNTPDMSVVEEVKRDLVGWKLGRVISVMDCGFASEENLKTLRKTGGHYIIGERMRSGKPETEEALSRPGRYRETRANLSIKEITIGDGEGRRRYMLVYNPKEAEKQRKTREKHVRTLEEELKTLRQLPDTAHTKAICRLRTHPSYGKYLTQDKSGTIRIDRAAVKAASRYDGKYLIRTSDDTLTAEDAVLGYKQLADVEDAFRTLKTHLELRPMYHRLEERIRAHITLCWLALLLVRYAEMKTGYRWQTIRDEFQRMHIGDFKAKDGTFSQVTSPTSKQREILAKLGLNSPRQYQKIVPVP